MERWDGQAETLDASAAAVAGGRFSDSGNNFYDTVGEYQATPTVPGFQYKAANL